MKIDRHLEKYLGKIVQGWNTPEEAEYCYSAAEFSNQPSEGLTTLATLGVSDHKLMINREKYVRQEFVMTSLPNLDSAQIASFLLKFSDLVLSRHEAVLRGQVIGPGKPLFSGSAVNAVYATNTVMFEESFGLCEDSDPPTVMVWLIPIYGIEARFIAQNGWEAFEDILEEQDIALWDFKREPLFI